VLKLAVVGKATELVIPTFKRLDSFLLEWNVSQSDKRDIFLSATNILKDQKGYGSNVEKRWRVPELTPTAPSNPQKIAIA